MTEGDTEIAFELQRSRFFDDRRVKHQVSLAGLSFHVLLAQFFAVRVNHSETDLVIDTSRLEFPIGFIAWVNDLA